MTVTGVALLITHLNEYQWVSSCNVAVEEYIPYNNHRSYPILRLSAIINNASYINKYKDSLVNTDQQDYMRPSDGCYIWLCDGDNCPLLQLGRQSGDILGLAFAFIMLGPALLLLWFQIYYYYTQELSRAGMK